MPLEQPKIYNAGSNPHFNAIQSNNRLGNLAKAVTIGGALITIGGLSVLAYLYFTGGAGLSFSIAGYTLHASTMQILYSTLGAAAITVTGGLWATGHAAAKKRAKKMSDDHDASGGGFCAHCSSPLQKSVEIHIGPTFEGKGKSLVDRLLDDNKESIKKEFDTLDATEKQAFFLTLKKKCEQITTKSLTLKEINKLFSQKEETEFTTETVTKPLTEVLKYIQDQVQPKGFEETNIKNAMTNAINDAIFHLNLREKE